MEGAIMTTDAKKNISTAAGKTGTAKPAARKNSGDTVARTVRKTTVKKAEAESAETTRAVRKPAVKKAEPKTPGTAKAKTVRKEETLKKLRLSKTDKKFFRDLLLHARSAFGEQVKFHSDDALSSRKDSAGERAGMATHMADLGTDNYRHDFELGLLSDEADVLEMIDEALQRLEDSEYGICLDCGEVIPRKRLEAKPYAKYCTKCKSKREAMDDTYYHRR